MNRISRFAAADIKLYGALYTGCHLRSNKTFPDKIVKLKLLACQKGFHAVRCEVHVRRTDGFMSILRVGTGFIEIGFIGYILRAVRSGNQRSGSISRFIRHTHRVCTHISDQTDCSARAEINTFIQLLRNLHRAFRAEAELFCGLLLHSRCDERRQGVDFSRPLFQRAHVKRVRRHAL